MRNTADSASTTPTPPTSPLANDENGNPLELADGAVAWLVRRRTGGRPKHQLEGNKQPMRFPLSYSRNDVEDILAPGRYRLDLVDVKDKYLDLTIKIDIGEPRNADGGGDEAERDDEDPERVPFHLPATASDVRLVLEANVRSMQLAFLHNERTLTASLRMADTLREGVHVLADAQADILKSVASSRGFLRNAQPTFMLPATKPAEPDEDEEDEDEEEADEEAEAKARADDKNERLMAFGMSAMALINNLVETFRGGQRAATGQVTTAPAQPTTPVTGGQPTTPAKSSGFLASLFDWRRASPQAAPTAVEPTISTPTSSGDIVRFMNELPSDLRIKLMTVRSQLTPDEQARLLPLVMAIPRDALPDVVTELAAKPVDELVAFFRAQLAIRVAA